MLYESQQAEHTKRRFPLVHARERVPGRKKRTRMSEPVRKGGTALEHPRLSKERPPEVLHPPPRSQVASTLAGTHHLSRRSRRQRPPSYAAQTHNFLSSLAPASLFRELITARKLRKFRISLFAGLIACPGKEHLGSRLSNRPRPLAVREQTNQRRARAFGQLGHG